MRFQFNSSFTRSILLLWGCHLILDFFTGIWPIYKTIAQIDIAMAGMIAGVSGFIGEFLQLFFGYFSDRGHRKKILSLGLLISSGVIFITFVEGMWSSFFILLLVMLGSGSFHPAAVGFAGALSRQNKSRAILFFASGGAIGLAISQLAFTKILSIHNGHALILFLPVALALLVVFFYPLEQQTNRAALTFKQFIAPIMLSRKPLLKLYLTQVANYTMFTAFIFLLPDLMRAKECHQWLCMGGGHLCFILGGALFMPPVGFLCDRYGQKPILLIIISTTLFLLYGFLSQSALSIWGSILFLSFLGGFMGTINPILVSWGHKIVPDNPSTISALLMGSAWCLASLGATWAGLIARSIDTNPIVLTLGWLGILFLFAFFLILRMPQPQVQTEAVDT